MSQGEPGELWRAHAYWSWKQHPRQAGCHWPLAPTCSTPISARLQPWYEILDSSDAKQPASQLPQASVCFFGQQEIEGMGLVEIACCCNRDGPDHPGFWTA